MTKRIISVVFLDSLVPNALTARRYGLGETGPKRTEDGRYDVEALLAFDLKQYAYYTTDQALKPGDPAVVDSPFGGYKVVAVVSIDENVDGVKNVRKSLVQRVNVEDYARAEAARKQRELLMAKIEVATAAARQALELEKLKELSPELAALIDQVKALDA